MIALLVVLAAPVAIAVPRIEIVSDSGVLRCNDSLDELWHEDLRETWPYDVRFVTDPLDACPTGQPALALPFRLGVRLENGTFTGTISQRSPGETRTATEPYGKLRELAKALRAELEESLSPGVPHVVDRRDAFDLTLPRRTRAELEARAAELRRAHLSTPRVVALLTAALGAGLLFLSMDETAVFKTEKGPDLRPFVGISLVLGSTALCAFGADDAAREDELEVVETLLGAPDPVGADVMPLDE